MFRLITARLQHIIATRLAGVGPVRRVGAVLGALLIDMAGVLLAWTAGLFRGPPFPGGADTLGPMHINQTLLLNAFLVVETPSRSPCVPSSSRAIRNSGFSCRWADTTAAYWYFWFGRVSSRCSATPSCSWQPSSQRPKLGGKKPPVAAQAVRVLAMTT